MLEVKKKSILILANTITVFLALIVNFLAIALPLNGKTTQELSDAYPNLFVPAGYVFSIWSVIYTLLIIFVVYQILYREKEFIEKISVPFILSNLFNTIWIFLWHYEQIVFSLIAMIGLLISLIIIYWKLEIGHRKVDIYEKIAVQIPFSVYLGWITVATVANVTVLLITLNWDRFGISDEIWTIIVLFVASIIAMILIITRNDFAYGIVPIWAFIGIVIKQFETSVIVAGAAGFFSLILLLTIIGKLFYQFYSKRGTPT